MAIDPEISAHVVVDLQAGAAMRDLLIAGVGVHSLEMAEIVERVNHVTPTWILLGFLSPDGSQVGSTRTGYPVIGVPDALSRYSDAVLIPANDWPRAHLLPRERLG